MTYLKLVRPLNLLMILFTMVLFRCTLVDNKFYVLYEFQPKLDQLEFILLVLTTLFVTAGGYVINDIFDTDIDTVNRPEKVLIDKKIDGLAAYNFYKVLVIAGISTTIVLAVLTKNIRLATVPVLITVALNFYAQYFKNQLLVGNIVVSVCSAFVLFLPGLYESDKTEQAMSFAHTDIESGIFLAAAFYGIFAFLTSFLREIVKDMEDIKGDDQYGCRTVPIVWGIKGAKLICFFLVFCILIIWGSVALFFPSINNASVSWVVLGVYILPLLLFGYFLYRAAGQAQFHRLSNILKVYMFLGISSMFYFFTLIAPNMLFLQYINYLKKII